MPGDDVLVRWRNSGTLGRLFLAGTVPSGTSDGEQVKGVRHGP